MSYVEIVNFDMQESTEVIFEEPDVFEFRKDKKWHWLQALCFMVLDKIGAKSMGKKITYQKIVFESEDIFDAIWKQRGHIIEAYNYDIDFIAMGGKDFQKMIGSPEIRQMMDFGVAGELRGPGGYKKVMGMHVRIIPSMEGILVIPKRHD